MKCASRSASSTPVTSAQPAEQCRRDLCHVHKEPGGKPCRPTVHPDLAATITGSNRIRALPVAAFVVTSDNPQSAPTTSTFTLQGHDAPARTNGFIAIAFGRSNWSVAAGGATAPSFPPAPAPGAEPSGPPEPGPARPQGGVINRTDPTIRTCYQQQVLQPTWTDLTDAQSVRFTAVSRA